MARKPLRQKSAKTEIVAFKFGCVVCVERVENGPWKLAWMIVPGLLGA